METQVITRRTLETALIEKCWKDPEFRKQVVSDPKSLFEKFTGQKLPTDMKIVIHEEDANTLHFSIPPAPANLSELSDEDLEKVAGGTDISFAVSLTIGILGVTMGAGGAAGTLAAAGIQPW